MPKRQVKPWREYVATLTPEQKERLLLVLLEYHLDEMGGEGDVRFREAEPGWSEAAIYWDASGESLLEG